MKLMKMLMAAALAVTALLALPAAAQGGLQDSSQTSAAGPLPPSYCPNIQTQWYASGTVPAGYYHSNSDGNCYPIPGCPSNQTWDTTAQSCGCAGGTTWDATYSTCHAPCGGGTAWNGSTCASICGGGTAWNGSSCVSICSGGQTWNGSSCSCPGSTVWNGSSCGSLPSFTGWSVTPANAVIGASNYTASWSTASATSASVNCTGANAGTYTLSPASGGSGALPVSVPGATNCTGTVTNAWGSANSPTSSLTAACQGGTSWNGSACVTVCSGGQSWNGSSCVCPGGQTWNGSSCGIAPAISLNITPASTNVGTPYSVTWSSSGSATLNAALSCSGANAASFTLSPATGGSGSLAATTPGTTNCSASVSNPWGSAGTGSFALSATCPGGQVWNGSACVAASPLSAVPNAGAPGTFGYVSPRLGGAGQQLFQITSGGGWSVSRSGFPAAGLMTYGSPTSGTWTSNSAKVYEYTVTQAASLGGNPGTVSPLTTTLSWTTLGTLSFIAKTPGGGIPEGDGRWTINIREKGTTTPVVTMTVQLDTANGD